MRLEIAPRLKRAWQWAREMSGRRAVRMALQVVFFAITVAIVVWVLYQNRVTLLTYPWHIQPGLLLLAFGIYAVDLTLAVWSWSNVLNRLSIVVPFREHFRIYALTLVAGRIPGAPWHIAGRAVAYGQHGISMRITGMASAIEIVLIMISGILCGFLIQPVLYSGTMLSLWLVIPAVGLGLVAVHPRMIGWLVRRLGKGEDSFTWTYRDSLSGLFRYLLVWLVGGGLLFYVISAIQAAPTVSVLSVIGIWGFSGGLAMIIQLSPTGFGLREITLTALLSTFMSPGLAIITAIVMRIFLTICEVVASIVAARIPRLAIHNVGHVE